MSDAEDTSDATKIGVAVGLGTAAFVGILVGIAFACQHKLKKKEFEEDDKRRLEEDDVSLQGADPINEKGRNVSTQTPDTKGTQTPIPVYIADRSKVGAPLGFAAKYNRQVPPNVHHVTGFPLEAPQTAPQTRQPDDVVIRPPSSQQIHDRYIGKPAPDYDRKPDEKATRNHQHRQSSDKDYSDQSKLEKTVSDLNRPPPGTGHYDHQRQHETASDLGRTHRGREHDTQGTNQNTTGHNVEHNERKPPQRASSDHERPPFSRTSTDRDQSRRTASLGATNPETRTSIIDLQRNYPTQPIPQLLVTDAMDGERLEKYVENWLGEQTKTNATVGSLQSPRGGVNPDDVYAVPNKGAHRQHKSESLLSTGHGSSLQPRLGVHH